MIKVFGDLWTLYDNVALKMEAVNFSEMFVTIYSTPSWHTRENCSRYTTVFEEFNDHGSEMWTGFINTRIFTKIYTVSFWVKKPNNLVDGYQSFGLFYCIYLGSMIPRNVGSHVPYRPGIRVPIHEQNNLSVSLKSASTDSLRNFFTYLYVFLILTLYT